MGTNSTGTKVGTRSNNRADRASRPNAGAKKAPADLAQRRIDRAIEKMKPALRELHEELRVELSGADQKNALNRYRAGELVKRAMDERKYGANAVKLLAVALSRNEDTLYDLARVASAWTSAVFAKLVERQTIGKGRLTFSHFVLIAKAPDARRGDLLEVSYAQALTVKALRNLVRGPRKRQRLAGDPSLRLFDAQDQSATKLEEWLAGIGRNVVQTPPGKKALGASIARLERLVTTMKALYAGDDTAAHSASQTNVLTKETMKSETSRKSPVATLFGGPAALRANGDA